MISDLTERGISPAEIDRLKKTGLDFDKWFQGFNKVEASVGGTVQMLRAHPLIPEDVRISGYVLDVETGKLTPAGG